jgi:putative addiction module antidote
MHFTLKLTQIGNSVGVVLPKEALAAMKLEKGDTVHLSATPEGFQLSPYDPTLEDQLQLGRKFMHDFRDTFHALAK